ncbi:MAG: single-stranded DNA-binding protein [Clostridiales bacterium]|nr:single-stranded DNA-binding protein [Clostridiales bacterium]
MAQVYVIGRVTADLELKTSEKNTSYVRFDIAENIGYSQNQRTQYLQICAMGDDAERLVRAHVKKGSLIWLSGSLELEQFTKKDGVTTDKRLKVLIDNWGFVPIGSFRKSSETSEKQPPDYSASISAPEINGEREILPD